MLDALWIEASPPALEGNREAGHPLKKSKGGEGQAVLATFAQAVWPLAFLARSCIGFISKMDITAQCLGKRSTKPCRSNPACWGKVLNVSCNTARLMSACQLGAFWIKWLRLLGQSAQWLMVPGLFDGNLPVGAIWIQWLRLLGQNAECLMLACLFDVYSAF